MSGGQESEAGVWVRMGECAGVQEVINGTVIVHCLVLLNGTTITATPDGGAADPTVLQSRSGCWCTGLLLACGPW